MDKKVCFDGLGLLRGLINTINENRLKFSEIRLNLSSHLTNSKATDWKSEVATNVLKDFEVAFKESEKDIEALEQIMQYVEPYLEKQYTRLQEYIN